MTDQQEKEFNSVIMAGLLHDIGKLLHRSKPGYDGKHAMASGDFLDDNETKCKLTNELYDLNLVEWLVRYHHSAKEKTLDAYFNNINAEQGIDRTRLWNYMKIVQNADSYSCAERNYEEQIRKDAEKRTAPLDSIFTGVSIVGRNETETYRYPLSTIDPLANFPQNISYLNNIKNYCEDFKNGFPDFVKYRKFDYLLNVLLDYLEEYTWCVPSDTRYNRADISLFDHLRSTAAIAACLYKNHCHELNNSSFKIRKNEFILIAGDFAGIQNYIFDITSKGSGGASKRLRARSFFIHSFSETAIHKILHVLELPLVCNLFSAAGKFILLAPNSDEVEERLESTKWEIEHEIHKRYFNQFSFLMTYRNIEKYRPDMDIGNFCQIADKMFHLLDLEKIQSSQPVFFFKEENENGEEEKVWNQAAFCLSDEEFQKYAKNGDCRICGKGPGEIDERSGTEENPVTIQVCRVCHMNKQIGEILPKKQFIGFGKGKGVSSKTGRIILFHGNDNSETYYVDLSDETPASSDDYYLIWNINDNKKGMTVARWPIVKKKLANHVLTDEGGSVVSFEDLARCSRWTNTENEEYGSDFLGVLKADVDNLGLIFSKGFDISERPKEAKRNFNKESKSRKVEDARTVSRFLTLSRMMELFFSGWIGAIVEEDVRDIQQMIIDCQPSHVDIDFLEKYLDTGVIDFKNIYTVYSGGDDLVLIGPWETMIMFAILLNAKFSEYSCQSKSFTLSAGLSFVKPKFPIAMAIREADALLEKSKREGKNRLTMFGTTVEWDQVPELLDFFLFLDKSLQSNYSNINMSFLYRLLDYHKMAVSYIDENRIEGLKFSSALSYDLGRNINKGNETQDRKNTNEELRQIHKLMNITKNKDSLMYRIRPSIFWALCRNRGVS
jgi:CRISPR-associated protein Csm1